MLRKPQVPRDCARIRPAAGAQRVSRNLQVARPLASLHLYHTALNDVVDVAVADGAVLALPVIDGAEDGLNFLRL